MNVSVQCPCTLRISRLIVSTFGQCLTVSQVCFFGTVILQIFGVVLFSVFSVVNGFTEIKKTPKCEKHTSDHDSIHGY